MDAARLISLALSAILINNIVLARFLGICPLLGASRNLDCVIATGFAVIFAMTLASVVTFGVYSFLLFPLHLEYLRTIAFVLVIAALAQLVEVLLDKFCPELLGALGSYLPFVTANCAVLGIAIINIDKSYGFVAAAVHSFAAGVGFMLVMLLIAGVNERLELAPVPESLKGFPVSFILTGLVAMAFLGFTGLVVVE